MNVPLRCTGGTKWGRYALAGLTFGITEGKKVFYHHAFVAEGVNEENPDDTVYFVGQFFEGDKIPKNYSNIASNDFQVL